MQIPEALKKTPVLIGGGVVIFIIIIFLAKRGSSASTSTATTQDNTAAQLATQASNVQIAQINADISKAQIQAASEVTLGSYTRDVSLADITSKTQVAGAKISADLQTTTQSTAANENVALQNLDYSHDIANRQLENQRVLGLTEEDTKRLLGTQANQVQQTLGVTQIDANRYLGTLAINSNEAIAMRDADLKAQQIDSQERIADFTTNRALTYTQITGANQVAAAKAAKPTWFQSLMGGLGGAAKLAEVFVP